MSAQQTGVGGVVPQGGRRQVKLVDDGRALVESVVDPEIELRIGERARAAVDPVADIDVDRRLGSDKSHRERARIPIGAGVVHGALNGPAPERARQVGNVKNAGMLPVIDYV